MKNILKIVDQNKYINNCVSNKNKHEHSLSYLIDKNISQSECIKMGIAIEKFLTDFIMYENKLLKNIKPKIAKGEKEKDCLFESDKVIYYFEIKSNLNLDTEKSKETVEKCISIYHKLKKEYPSHKIVMRIIGARYYSNAYIPKILKNKYLKIGEYRLLGLNEMFKLLNISFKFNNEQEYKFLLNYIVDKMF